MDDTLPAEDADDTLPAPVAAEADTMAGSGPGGPPDRDWAPAPGDTLGRYRIGSQLGAGGMGTVFLATDPELGRKIAVKVLRSEMGSSAGEQRLLREAKAMARLAHPNLVAVHDVGTEAGRVFIAMEFVEGTTLTEFMAEHHDDPRRVLQVLIAAGRGLQAAHVAGFIHRDFKPDNVLVTPDGTPKVLDFGLARALDDATPEAPNPNGGDVQSLRLTRTGAVLGTPAYMSPEQHEGGRCDARTDVFSFAVTAYEALWGRRPFLGDSYPQLVRSVLEGEVETPPSRPEVSPRVFPVIARALAREPEDRFSTMAELVAALEDAARSARERAAEKDVFGAPLLWLPAVSTLLLGWERLELPLSPRSFFPEFMAGVSQITLLLIVCGGLAIVGTAVLVALDAGLLGLGAERQRDGIGAGARPSIWALAQLLVWPLAYPAYMHTRATAGGYRTRVGMATALSIAFTVLFVERLWTVLAGAGVFLSGAGY